MRSACLLLLCCGYIGLAESSRGSNVSQAPVRGKQWLGYWQLWANENEDVTWWQDNTPKRKCVCVCVCVVLCVVCVCCVCCVCVCVCVLCVLCVLCVCVACVVCVVLCVLCALCALCAFSSLSHHLHRHKSLTHSLTHSLSPLEGKKYLFLDKVSHEVSSHPLHPPQDPTRDLFILFYYKSGTARH